MKYRVRESKRGIEKSTGIRNTKQAHTNSHACTRNRSHKIIYCCFLYSIYFFRAYFFYLFYNRTSFIADRQIVGNRWGKNEIEKEIKAIQATMWCFRFYLSNRIVVSICSCSFDEKTHSHNGHKIKNPIKKTKNDYDWKTKKEITNKKIITIFIFHL